MGMAMIRRVFGLGGCLLLSAGLLVALPARAQSPADIDAAARQADRIQNEQRERIERQRQRDLQSDQPPTQLDAPRPSPKPRDDSVCRDIREIRLTGISLLNRARVDAVVDPYRGTCMSAADIEGLMSALTTLYIDKGYVAARAYLPAQDLSAGTLQIEVVEGRVSSLVVKDGGQGSIHTGNVAPFAVGQPLNLRDLEQALDQINRLQSNNATLDIAPGETAGDSVVSFVNQPSRRWHLGLTYDNSGQESTGQNQGGINLALDNPLGLNDYIAFTHRRALPYDTGKRSSYLDNLSYVIPFGYSTLSLNASDSEYASVFEAPSGADISTNGNSKNYAVRLDHVLWRGQESYWNLSGSLTRKKTENYLEGLLLEVSSRRLTVFDLDTSFSTQFLGGALTLNTGIARGLRWFEALEDESDLPDFAPRAQFTTLKYGFSFYRPFTLAGESLTLSSQFSGQHAFDALYGSEQMSVGSYYTVRGFSEAPLSGDHGYYSRNELSLSRVVALPGGQVALLRPYLGADYGKTRNRVSNGSEGELSSASIGIGLYLGALSLDVLYAHPISAPDFVDDQIHDDSTYFTLSLSI